MVTLNTITDYWIMLGWAALFGTLGGFIFELLLNRGPDNGSGRIEEPRRYLRERLTELGWIASCIIGAAAAVAILYFFPPTIVIEESGSTTTQYDLVALVALSIIAGSGGPGVFQLGQLSIQRRLTATVNEEQARAKTSEGQYYLQRIGNAATREAEIILRTTLTEEVGSALDQALQDTPHTQAADITARIQAVLDPLLEHSVNSLRESVDTQVNLAQEALDRPLEGAH